MAEKDMEARRKSPLQDRENPTQGFDNPFFRDHEEGFNGQDLTIISPNRSIFDESRTRKDGSNVMEDVLKEQAPAHAKRAVVGKKGKR